MLVTGVTECCEVAWRAYELRIFSLNKSFQSLNKKGQVNNTGEERQLILEDITLEIDEFKPAKSVQNLKTTFRNNCS
ncbi:hypothetical protein [Bathymodiolus platifrons methanotrophic gill symbiont]|uniref:hypothetical protein n=1 Tax=Bathymodiolus platifrons methanotrophic gill symbiont TaxID=113268 RepID=UPI000B418090|nr:hypothetical protein [Bathymodiolus platifrons methanotrophic gill symbiont]